MIAVFAIYVFYATCVIPCFKCLTVYCERANPQEVFYGHQGEDDEKNDGLTEQERLARLDRQDNSDDIYMEYKIKSLKDFYIRAQKEFELFRTMLNAVSYDQDKLPDQEAKHYKKRLKQRIRYIEDVIDVHLNNINGLELFMDKSYLYKLSILELNETKIT